VDPTRLEHLCQASVDTYFIPERDVDWEAPMSVQTSPVPESCIYVAGLAEFRRLDPAGRARVGSCEFAAMLSAFIRLENAINTKIGQLVHRSEACAAELPYLLHVLEEEARHSRMFARLINRIGVGGFRAKGMFGAVERLGTWALSKSDRAFFLSVLAVEEVTDQLFAAILADGRGLTPIVEQVCKIHRVEEARHIFFVRDKVEQALTGSGPIQWLLRVAAPVLHLLVFELLVTPEVYRRSGMCPSVFSAWRTWWRARNSPHRKRLRARCTDRARRFFTSIGAMRGSYPVWTALKGPQDSSSQPRPTIAQ
jgi:hypothetical protein